MSEFVLFKQVFAKMSFLQVQDPGGGGALPYKGLMGTCGQQGYMYVFRDFCLKQGIEFIIFFVFMGLSVYQCLSSTGYLFLDDEQQSFYKLLLINTYFR